MQLRIYLLTFVIAIFLKILTNYVLCIRREIQKVEFMCTATSDTAPEILTAFSFIHAKKLRSKAADRSR